MVLASHGRRAREGSPAIVGIVLAGPVQIAHAVTDVAAAAQDWAARGAGPFFVREHIDVHRVRINGQPGTFDHSSAYGQWGGLMLELIQQHDGGANPIVGSDGIHHVAYFAERFADAARELVAAGHPEVLYAETAGGMPFAFHDARPTLGHLIEIYERTPPLEGFYEMVRRASVGWDGTDPVRRLPAT